MLAAAQATETAIDHNGKSCAQSLTFLHANGTQSSEQPIGHHVRLAPSMLLTDYGQVALTMYLWDVRMTERPDLTMSRIRFHKNRRDAGSIPVVGSS